MKYGFVRVSNKNQEWEQKQINALKSHGAEEIIVAETGVDYFSLAIKLVSGDALYITSLDRLNRDYEKAVLTVFFLRAKNVTVYIDGQMVNDFDMLMTEIAIKQQYHFKQSIKKKMQECEEEMTEEESMLIDYIMNNMHWCPFHDECGIDFEAECVGFREEGCKECIYRNITKLNISK